MSAAGVWTGLGDSVFLAGVGDRDRDPPRVALTVAGGAAVGLVAATCCLLLVLVAYAILIGEGARGLEGLSDAAQALGEATTPTAGQAVLMLVMAAAVDAVFWVVFVAFAAVIVAQPLIAYVTAAVRIRWRLLAVAGALSAAAMAPMVVAERLLSAPGSPPPFLAISPFLGERLAYVAAALLLVPAAAAAEELFFRGWLLRQLGAFLRRPLPLIATTALSFSALHFDFAPDVFLTRALMGAGFAYMTLRLGGIEFSTGAHAVNNLLIVLFLQPLNLDQSAGPNITAFSLIEDLFLVGGYVLITELVARSPAMRWLAGLRLEEVSPSRTISARFG
jgi:membrane protease YdiL (CAAX protease family)